MIYHIIETSQIRRSIKFSFLVNTISLVFRIRISHFGMQKMQKTILLMKKQQNVAAKELI